MQSNDRERTAELGLACQILLKKIDPSMPGLKSQLHRALLKRHLCNLMTESKLQSLALPIYINIHQNLEPAASY